MLRTVIKYDDRILDLGCGTGFFLDHISWPRTAYLGVDPSGGMCRRFLQKHPLHQIIQSRLAEDIIERFNPSLVLGLHAVGDHLDQQDIRLVSEVDYFMMFSLPNITNPSNPIYQDHAKRMEIECSQQALVGDRQVFDDSYLIVSSRSFLSDEDQY